MHALKQNLQTLTFQEYDIQTYKNQTIMQLFSIPFNPILISLFQSTDRIIN